MPCTIPRRLYEISTVGKSSDRKWAVGAGGHREGGEGVGAQRVSLQLEN